MKTGFNWDALGIATSLACAIHCAILPLVLSSLPLFGLNIIDNVGFEYFMIALAFAIGSFSLWHGFRKHHHSYLPLLVFSAGILFLVAKQLWHSYQYWLLPFAVVLIVSAHLINYRSCRVHNHAHADDCDHGH
jgi:TRAP-type C4-dicarboxylate transport system permease small subunit